MSIKVILSFCFLLAYINTQAQTNPPFSSENLMEPAILAQKINQDKMDDLLLIHIGFQNFIKGSVNAGPATEPEGIERLKELVREVPKDQEIVLYCGCCPMDVCPNIHPGYDLLHEMGYTQIKILNLTSSIKADWLDKDYPVIKGKM